MEHVKIFRDLSLALDIGHWLIDLSKMRVYWPSGLGVKSVRTTYVWSSFDEVCACYPDPQRRRFLKYIEDIVQNPGEDRLLTISARGSGPALIAFRMVGRCVRIDDGAWIYGVIEPAPVGQPATDQARSLALILEAVFNTSSSGILVFDENLRIIQSNRNAIAMFRIPSLDADQAEIFASMQRRMPADIRERLVQCLRQRAMVQGVRPATAENDALQWTANPWGKGVNGARGVVMVFSRIEDASARHPAEPEALNMLEYVRNPVLILSSSTAEIRFANQSARKAFHMDAHGRHFVKNLAQFCGRAVPTEAFDEVRRGGHFVNLKSGARLRKVDGRSEELLVEYAE